MTERDFASDARPAKARAREMYTMLGEINRRLSGLRSLDGTAAPLSATCFTCHRAHPRPRRIEQVLAATRSARGIDAALLEYRELRQRHLATGGYDFSVKPLVREARALLEAKDPAAARKVMALALELGFDTLSSRSTLAEIALAEGDRAGAVAHLEKALAHARNPAEREFVEELIEKARAEASEPASVP
jgi:Flp pilus assembly protein TadD